MRLDPNSLLRGKVPQNKSLSLTQLLDLIGILIDASDRPAVFGKAGSGNETDITGPDHADFHARPCLNLCSTSPKRGANTAQLISVSA
jgi:hypothetical protein